jgi:alkylhydroperoxidase family enzyme
VDHFREGDDPDEHADDLVDLIALEEETVLKGVSQEELDREADAGVDEDDLDTLREHGFTDDEIWDLGAITALFALSNRMAHLSPWPPTTGPTSWAGSPRPFL